MPFQITGPQIEEFELREFDAKHGIDPNEPTRVAIRRASFRDESKHDQRFAAWQAKVQDGSLSLSGPRYAPAEIVEYEIYLVLADCNILDADGKPLFDFVDGRLAMSEAEFKQKIGKLPEDLILEIHKYVLEVNPQWNAANPNEKKG